MKKKELIDVFIYLRKVCNLKTGTITNEELADIYLSINESKERQDAIENFKTEFYKAFRIPEITEWLSKKLK